MNGVDVTLPKYNTKDWLTKNKKKRKRGGSSDSCAQDSSVSVKYKCIVYAYSVKCKCIV